MWGLGILKGMTVSMRNMLRGPITIRYPEQRPRIPERARWAVRPRFHDDGSPRCTACLVCIKECPDEILHVSFSAADDGTKHIESFTYEQAACMMCGLCVQACPFSAIEMSECYELATTRTEDLVHTLLSDVDASTAARSGKDSPGFETDPVSGRGPTGSGEVAGA